MRTVNRVLIGLFGLSQMIGIWTVNGEIFANSESFAKELRDSSLQIQFDNIVHENVRLSPLTKQYCPRINDSINYFTEISDGLVRGELIKDIAQSSQTTYECLELLAQDLMVRLQEESSLHKEILAKSFAFQFPITVDYILLGGGVHNGIMAANIKRFDPQAKILVVEANGNFTQHFRSRLFRINSSESGSLEQSSNVFPGAILQVADFDQDRFPLAMTLWLTTFYAYYQSDSHILFQTRVNGIEKSGKEYLVSFAEGGKIRAKKIIIGSGLGGPEFGRFDGKTERFLISEHEKIEQYISQEEIPSAIFIDDFIHLEFELRTKGVDVYRKFLHKKIAVIGAGDGGNVLVEYFYQKSPKDCYGISDEISPDQLCWYNQKNMNFLEFAADPNIRDRYRNNFESVYQEGGFKPIPHYVQSIEKNPVDGGVIIKDITGEIRKFDHVLIVAGYKNRLPALLQTLLGRVIDLRKDGDKWFPRFQSHDGRFVSRQVVNPENGEKENIFIIGTAAYPLATSEDINASRTKNAVSINVLGPKTQSMAFELSLLKN